ncbi:hypothetical protein ASPVEDRAFT_66267 [Aspergillus versicolor CBS 583.65]|uniref:Zn(2)-C6 fungal-type domain-containing protein n=1 Tax=Aspergillus versicolor CBS 583.65 TaxID=1036611 RepID=A0A1L9Q319_ASPVE|nr:uncharacterized protein ASPVEDRAFT_66267 [Aspergillus versicolor CBS 583.65]OJJ08164.1 hypothetical protein ASPVEDRAFT_66267 [Aspergillus versicolor CBS 583.65]
MTRHRKHTKHVRSGCRTCKIRRVKCDEQQPACRRCLSSGRVCDGYGIWSETKRVPALEIQQNQGALVNHPDALPDLGHEEKRQLDRFRNTLSDKLAQPFGSHFWKSLVLQLSQSEPAVLHASLALTSAYERFVQDQGQPDFSSVSASGLFSLRQYNHAIRALVCNNLLDTALSLRIAIVSCVLFVCLEILRGDVNAMHAHFAAGIKLLRQLQHLEQRLPTSKSVIMVKDDPDAFDDHLVEIFARLNMQFLMLGHGPQVKETFSPAFQYGIHLHIPRCFYSVHQARQSANPILLSTIHFVMETEQLSFASNVHPISPSAEMLEKRRALQGDVAEWITGYESSINSHLASISWNESLGLITLRVYAEMSTILLDTCFSTKETAYDPHLSSFKWIIERYREFHKALQTQHCTAPPYFTIDLSLFPPLYFTALKCRDWRTRHEALAILGQYHHMEGPWTGAMLAIVAGHAVRLEEKHFEGALQSSAATSNPAAPTSPSTGPSLVLPEFARIHCVDCKLPARRAQESCIASLTLKRFRHELGKTGGWEVNKCSIDLTSRPQTALFVV